MTLLSDPPVSSEAAPSPPSGDAANEASGPPRGLAAPRRRRIAPLIGLVVIALVACLVLVLYALEPMFQRRQQRLLLEDYREQVDRSANEAQGFAGVEIPVDPPAFGAPVAVLETNALQWQQVIVEGVSSTHLEKGPGHVPGTAGPGQPGNVVIVGRQAAYGGPFERLGELVPGDEIVFTTTQGQSVYEVASVDRKTLLPPGAGVDELYAPTENDRLTLVTSASAVPWNDDEATVVVADRKGVPFAPTPQNERSDTQTGLTGGSFDLGGTLLILAGLGVTIAGSIWCYRRYNTWVAYLLTVGPLLALTILAAEAVSRLLPAWT